MKLIAATLLCDRKREFMLTALPHLFDIPEVDRVYVNIESSFNNTRFVYGEMFDWLKGAPKPYDYDIWEVRESYVACQTAVRPASGAAGPDCDRTEHGHRLRLEPERDPPAVHRQ